MPYKLREDRRHKFSKARYKITNWPDYNEALKQRGNITIWFSAKAISLWYSKKSKHQTRGAQIKYSDIAIETGLLIKSVYHLPLRATEGLLISIAKIMQLNVDIPDYSTFSRRAKNLNIEQCTSINSDSELNLIVDSTGLKIFGAGEWHEEKHGLKKRRIWRKLHLIINRNTHEIIASELTDYTTSDDSQVAILLDQISGSINSFKGDMAYDTDAVYESIRNKSAKPIEVSIPPRKDAALSAYLYPSDEKHSCYSKFMLASS